MMKQSGLRQELPKFKHQQGAQVEDQMNSLNAVWGWLELGIDCLLPAVFGLHLACVQPQALHVLVALQMVLLLSRALYFLRVAKYMGAMVAMLGQVGWLAGWLAGWLGAASFLLWHASVVLWPMLAGQDAACLSLRCAACHCRQLALR
jgi:hypothetical protein